MNPDLNLGGVSIAVSITVARAHEISTVDSVWVPSDAVTVPANGVIDVEVSLASKFQQGA